MCKQFKVNLVKGHSGVNKDLHQEVIYKIINSVILQLVLQSVFSSVLQITLSTARFNYLERTTNIISRISLK